MPHALKEMPRVAFTRAEMPPDQQTQFYKQTTDSINAVGQNVKNMDTMLSNWRGWLNGMFEQQERLGQRLEALEGTFNSTKDKYTTEAKELKQAMLDDHEDLARVKGVTEGHITEIEALLTRCDEQMKQMNEAHGQQLLALNTAMDQEFGMVKAKIQDKVNEISEELVRHAQWMSSTWRRWYIST